MRRAQAGRSQAEGFRAAGAKLFAFVLVVIEERPVVFGLLVVLELLARLALQNETHDDADHKTACTVTSSFDSVTMEDEIATSGTQNKRKQIKINQNKVNHLPNPPQGGDEGGKYLKSRTAVTQEDIDCLQPPCDGVQRNFQGLTDNLRLYKVPPSEQYAIILKSNFGAIGNPVWKGFNTIRGSNGKIRLPGHYLLSIIN